MPVQHGDADRTANSGRGIHGILGFADVVDEAARAAIVQTAADRGRVVEQTAGVAPGLYLALGVTGEWSRVGLGRQWSTGARFTDTQAAELLLGGFTLAGEAPQLLSVCAVSDGALSEIRLYDTGPAGGSSTAGVLRATLNLASTTDTRQDFVGVVPVASPSTDGEILDSARSYEVRAIYDPTSAGVPGGLTVHSCEVS